MDKDYFKETERMLYKYKTLVAEVENLKIAITELENDYKGCSAITYEEKTAPTNKFNSIVENEVINKERALSKYKEELEAKELLKLKIENALEPLEERERQIVNLKYFKRVKTWNNVGEIVNLTGEYCRDLNKKIVTNISKVLFVEKYI